MCTDDEHRSCSFKSHTALDADDGVAHMAVAADAVSGADLLHLLYGLYLVVIFLSVDRAELALVEAELQYLRSFLGDVLQICALRQTLCGVENLATANTCSPDTYVVAVLQFREVSEISVGIEIVHLFLA